MTTAEASPLLTYSGESILGSGELAAKTFATWLPAPVESVLHASGQGRTWEHRALAPRASRHEIAVQAVRRAIGEALIPFEHMQTAPSTRQVRDNAIQSHGIELADEEIHGALVEVMGA